MEKEKKASAFKRDTCNAKVRGLQALMSRHRYACSHAAKHLNDEGVRFDAGRAAVPEKQKMKCVIFCAVSLFQ